jgi:hypothetical protein
VRVFLACLRDDRLTVLVILMLTDRSPALASSRLTLGYYIVPVP